MKQIENLNGVYNMIDKVGEHMYAVLSDVDFGYDSKYEAVHEGEIIMATVAIRNQVKDYFVKILVGGLCLNIWSKDIPNKLFFTKEEAYKRLSS